MIRSTLICILLFVPACSMLSKDDGSVRKRSFSSADASREIVLAPNRTFEIVLPSNPSTGYDWVLSINHPEVVHNVSHRYTPDSSGRVGVSGETTWSLRTGKTGETKLTFSYKRQWETDVLPTRVEVFTIDVR
ncbi:MAG: protease inhibitor I42 family protein [Phycisphaerales bacterium]|nr:protease inhibitor I42 family protein [Planctomycetota bacterium]MBL6997709.1 protease inhibitor I42 family protein [Phycisphaerales bacterium]